MSLVRVSCWSRPQENSRKLSVASLRAKTNNGENVLGYKYEGIDETKVSNVLKEISKKFGKGSLIAGAYIESDEFNAMKNYADEYFEYTTSKSSDDEYSLMSNSCATFCYDVIGKDESKQLSMESPLPLDMIRTYRFLYRKVSYDESREEYQIER